MHLYCGQVKELVDCTEAHINNLLIDGIKRNQLTLEEFNKNEINTWGKSIKRFVKQLEQARLTEISIVLEYFVPGNLLRLDAVLIGYNHSSQLHVMVVEMKEWGAISASPDAHHVDIGMSDNPIRQHPAAQLNHYITSLQCYHSELQKNKNIQLSCISFMPNFTMKDQLFEQPHLIYKKHYEKSCFAKDDDESLAKFLQANFINEAVATSDVGLFTNGVYSMNEASLAGISKAMRGERFVSLLDEQCDVKVEAMKLINSAFHSNQQLVMIIKGDAGTGKTILGLDLIRQYINKYPASYFGTIPLTLRTIIDGYNKDYAFEHNLAEPAKLPTVNAILRLKEKGDLVVIDEAHRLTDVQDAMTSLMNRFKVIVLLQDDHQRIKISEKGTVENITNALGYQPAILNLSTQQRAKNSGTFIKNVNAFINHEKPVSVDLKSYELRTNLTLNEIDIDLKAKESVGASVKWLAPYCWSWDQRANDIKITDYDGSMFTKAWNPKPATQYEWYRGKDSNHLEQVGCIYTAQGLEFDYVGFIFWDDLKYDEDSRKWQVSLKENYDFTFVNEIVTALGGAYNSRMKQVIYKGVTYELDQFIQSANASDGVSELVRNIYRVLLTRGKKGLYIWFKDVETKRHFDLHFGRK